MNLSQTSKRVEGFTKCDLLVVVCGVLLLFLWLPYYSGSRCCARAPRINCISNLKQAGLAFRMWANDHDDVFPERVSTSEGGSAEYVQTGRAVWHFQAHADELVSPRVLKCPDDEAQSLCRFWGKMMGT